MYHCKRLAGFTLIELLVVMAIMAVSLSIVLPLTMQQIDGARYRAERARTLIFLSQYQSLSYFRAEPITIAVSGKTIVADYNDTSTSMTLEYISFTEQSFAFSPSLFTETIELNAYINQQPWRLVVADEATEWLNTN